MKVKTLLWIAMLTSAVVTVGNCQAQTEGQEQEDAALAVGDPAPNFELETFDGETVTLSERFGEEGKPVILLFSRANW